MELLTGLQNIELLILGFALASSAILGYVVFLNNRKAIANQSFLLFAIFTCIWSVLNFLISKFNLGELPLIVLRLSIFSAVWHAFSFFQLTFVFPRVEVKFPFLYKFVLFPAVASVSILTLTPLVFKEINEVSTSGLLVQVSNGPLLPLFGLTVATLIIGGLFLIAKRVWKSSGVEKIQAGYMLAGSAITFFLLIVFNFIFPAFLNNSRFINYGALFLLPFIVLTTYAILKHHLLQVKVITTEILAFLLTIIMFIEIILSNDIVIMLFRISAFTLVLIFSIFLIKSVRREVEQREKLQELSRAKSEFMSIASHQLRTPISILKGYLSLMQEGSFGTLSPKQQEVIEKTYTTNEDMMRLVNDLLNVTRAEEGRLQYVFSKVNLTELTESIARGLELNIKEKGLQLILELPQTPIFVNADKDKLTQVISNLIDNSSKYTEQGSIKVNLAPNKGTATVTVSDTGLGIGKEEMQHMFESFSRGKAGQKSWTKGTGLGLYIAKQFITAHKGRIWAESAGERKGSTFFVEIPTVS